VSPAASAPAVQAASPTAPQSTTKPVASSKPASAASQKPAQQKLTAQQKKAIDILQGVEGELGRFSPEMQVYLLTEIAMDYKGLDRAKRTELLNEALAAAVTMPEGNERSENERSIVFALTEADPAALPSLEHSTEPQVRELAQKLLVKQDVDQGRLMAAVQELSQWDTSAGFPYLTASKLILKLGAQQSGERQAVFASAIEAYRGADVHGRIFDTMSYVIEHCYEVLPPAMVAEAIDLVLNKATKSLADRQLNITLGGKSGHATFDSVYDLQLFELLPVLDKVDPAKAEMLRREHAAVAALTNKYPNGRSSLSPDPDLANLMASTKGDPDSEADVEAEFGEQRRRADAIVEAGAKAPDSAIASAQTLSNTPRSEYEVTTLRCRALDAIATSAMQRKNATAANAALKALVAAAQDLPTMARAHYMVQAAALSAQMNDPQAAKQYLNKAMKAADEQYHNDAFGDPPNEASKYLWPSTAVWKGALVVAEHIDTGYAAEGVASLPDPEIEAVVNVARAGVMLDQEPGFSAVAVWHNGEPVVETVFDIPWWSMAKGDGKAQGPR